MGSKDANFTPSDTKMPLTVVDYIDSLTKERKKLTDYDKDLDITMTWTTRMELKPGFRSSNRLFHLK